MWTANLLQLSSVISVTLLHYYIDERRTFLSHLKATHKRRITVPTTASPSSLLRFLCCVSRQRTPFRLHYIRQGATVSRLN